MQRVLIFLLALCAAATSQADGEPNGPALVWSKTASFAETRDTLNQAIAARGLVVSYVSHAATMLDRTAEAVGATRRIYDEAEIVLFCKSDLSYRLVESNPHNIVLCPYSVAIYTLTTEPGRVYLSIPRPYAGDPVVEPIAALLAEIIEEVVAW